MPHIECVKNNGKPYLRLAESRYIKNLGRQKKFIIKNIGPLSKYDDGKPDFLKRFREQFKNGEIDFEGITYYSNIPNKKTFEIESNMNYIQLKNIGSLFLNSIYKSLGINDVLNKAKSDSKIEYDLNGLTKLLVFGRILDPKSKRATFENKDKYLFPVTASTKEAEIYRALDVLDKKASSIQIRMNTKIKRSAIGRNTELTYYDVTNYFFETMYGDDDIYALDKEGNKILDDNGKPIILEKGLRKKGVCKNNTPNPLVAMGLFIDNNGIPVSYNLFPGNTQDKTTFKTIIEKSIINKESDKVIVVADNGIYAQENMYLLVTNGNGYIISKAVKKHWHTKLNVEESNQGLTTLREWALDNEGYVYSYNSGGTIKSKTKSRIYNRILKDSNGNTITIKEKQVLFWNKKHYDKELHQNEKFIEYLESCKEHPDKLKDKQRKSQDFIKIVQTNKKTGEIIKTKPLVILLEDKIQKYKETMGFYSIVTSEIEMEDNEVKAKYHGLSRIEDSFKIIKSDLEGRPIYVWTKEHINAHFLICFIALTIIRLIQHKILKSQGKDTLNVDGWESGITAERIKEALNNFKACSDKNGTCLISEPKMEIGKILESIGLELPDLTSIDKIDKFKNILNKGSFM